jgi:hypothetical protein
VIHPGVRLRHLLRLLRVLHLRNLHDMRRELVHHLSDVLHLLVLL